MNENEVDLTDEKSIIRQAIATLLIQYTELFHKAKLFDTKKLAGLQKQIKNYLKGFINKTI
jgi:hypothetical protein